MKKRKLLILLISALIATSVFAKELIIGSGNVRPSLFSYFYNMETTDCSLKSGLYGFDFDYTETNRTFIDCDGVMRGLTIFANGAEYDSNYILGSELLTDGGIETWTGDDPDNFTVVETGTSVIKDETSIVYSGSHSCKAEVSSTNAEVGIYQLESFTEGRVYYVSIWIYGSAGESVMVRDTDTGTTGGLAEEIFAPGGTWTFYEFGFKANANSDRIYVRRNYSGVPSAWEFYVDDIVCKEAMMDARVESDGVLLEPGGANLCLRSRNFTHSEWTAAGTPVLTKNQVGICGTSNKAWTVEDNTVQASSISQQFLRHSGGGEIVASVFVKKTTSASTFPGFGLYGPTGYAFVTINTDAGTLTDYSLGGPDDSWVIDTGGDFWRVFVLHDFLTATSATVYIYGAVNNNGSGTWDATETGSAVFDAVQVEIQPYPSTYIGTSYIDNDDVGAGSDLATDGDCSGGTLTMETGWTHDSINNEYDCTAGVLNLTDANIIKANTIYRIKTVWGNITAGEVQVKLGGVPGQLITANGTYYDYIMAVSATDLTFDAITLFTGSLQEYEVIEYGSARKNEATEFTYTKPDQMHWFNEDSGTQPILDTCLADNTGDWTKTDCTLVFDTDHYEVNYVAATQHAYLPATETLTVGKLLKFTIAVKDGTSVGVSGAVRITDDSHNIKGCDYPFTTTSAWVYHTFYAVIEEGATGLEMYSEMTGAGNYEFRNISTVWMENQRDTGDGTYGNHGTAIVWWKPGFNKADGVATDYILSNHAGGGGHMIYFPAAGDPTSHPGGTAATVALAYTKGTSYKLAVKWGYFSVYSTYYINMYRIGYDSGSGITWGTAQVYDGNWRPNGPTLMFGRSIADPFHIKRLRLYDSILTDGEINATPSP